MRIGALLAYVLSFALIAVWRGNLSFPGYFCAYVTLVTPLLRGNSNFGGTMIEFVAFVISGWINIAFLASMAIRWRGRNGRAFRILRVITLAMIPFCWVVLVFQRLHPREGHIVWIMAMVVALFSENTLPRRVISGGSST